MINTGKKKGKILIFLSVTFIFLSLGFFVKAQVTGTDTTVIDLAEKARDYFIEATKGNIQGQTTGLKFGENLGVGTTEEDIQSQGGVLTFLQSAELISIVSTDTVNDISSGSGARQVRIFGLDENFTKIEELVNLSATATNTTQEYIRVYRMYVTEVGTYGGVNQGDINGVAAVTGSTQIQIAATQSQSETSHYTVPAGHKLIIKGFRVTVDTGKEIDFFGKIRENADVTSGGMGSTRIIRTVRGLDSPIAVETFGNSILNEKTDLWGSAVVTTGTAEVTVDYDFVEFAIGN